MHNLTMWGAWSNVSEVQKYKLDNEGHGWE